MECRKDSVYTISRRLVTPFSRVEVVFMEGKVLLVTYICLAEENPNGVTLALARHFRIVWPDLI